MRRKQRCVRTRWWTYLLILNLTKRYETFVLRERDKFALYYRNETDVDWFRVPFSVNEPQRWFSKIIRTRSRNTCMPSYTRSLTEDNNCYELKWAFEIRLIWTKL